MHKRAANQPIRVLVAEDSRAQRELLVGLLRAAGMDVAGTAGDGYAAVAEARRLRPDVIAMDSHIPGLDGYAATRQIMQSCPTPIVLISSASDASQRTVLRWRLAHSRWCTSRAAATIQLRHPNARIF